MGLLVTRGGLGGDGGVTRTGALDPMVLAASTVDEALILATLLRYFCRAPLCSHALVKHVRRQGAGALSRGGVHRPALSPYPCPATSATAPQRRAP